MPIAEHSISGELAKGGAQPDVTPPGPSQGAFLDYEVNGFRCRALLDTGAQAKIISDILYHRVRSCTEKLLPQQKPVLGANNMSLDILGSVKVTLQLGGIEVQDMVFVCGGLAPAVLVGIDFLRTHKCVLNFDTETNDTKEGPSKRVFGHLDKVCRITVAETVTLLPNMVENIPCQMRVFYLELNGAVQYAWKTLKAAASQWKNYFPSTASQYLRRKKRRHYEVLATNANCVLERTDGFRYCKRVQHIIDTGSAQPIQAPPRRVPFHKRGEIRRQVDEMLEAGIIEPCESPWSSPVVLVAKPDGSQRFEWITVLLIL
ncbi:hypothetical protein ACROYT_G025641 [Oculina patagonica]